MKTERELNNEARQKAEDFLQEVQSNFPDALNCSPFLTIRTGLVSKLLFLNEIYLNLIGVPGAFVEFGAWHGQTSILLENLRAVHEPFNMTRLICSIDTFEGYPEASGLHISDQEVGKYIAGSDWLTVLDQIQNAHKTINAGGNGTVFRNIKANILDDEFWSSGSVPEAIAFAYFDIATYETTRTFIAQILPRMVTGGIVVFDDFGPAYPGVQQALDEAKLMQKYELKHSKVFPSKLWLKI